MKRRRFLRASIKGVAGLSILSSIPKDLKGAGLSRNEASGTLVLVLGTAQDGGIPQIGCYCPNCIRAREDGNFARLISSLAILDFTAKKVFVVDTTPDMRRQYDRLHERTGRDRTGRRNVPDGILLTHAHIGHYPGLMFYGYESLSASSLPVFCSEKMGRYLSGNGPWSLLVSQGNISLRNLSPGKRHALTSDVTITPLSVPHRSEFSDTLGFKIRGKKKGLLYIPDIQGWDAWDRSIIEEVEGADIALLDGTFFGPGELPDRDPAQIGHPFITTTVEILKETVTRFRKKVCFTHLNHTNPALDPGGEPRRFIEESGFDLAADGMEFFL